MTRYFALLVFLFLPIISAESLWAQQVIIGDTTLGIEPTAVLQLSDTSHGFLLPRLTTAQRNALQSPAEGL